MRPDSRVFEPLVCTFDLNKPYTRSGWYNYNINLLYTALDELCKADLCIGGKKGPPI